MVTIVCTGQSLFGVCIKNCQISIHHYLRDKGEKLSSMLGIRTTAV